MEPRTLSEPFQEALAYAVQLHREQARKGSTTPYVAHLLAVAAIVLEHGGDQEQAIAALLHDAIEDQGGDAVRQEIRARFGDRVVEMVDDCTDAEGHPKPPWRQRKEAYIAHMGRAHPDSLLISMADKFHNASAIVRDYRRVGPSVFDRFQASPDETAWYYRSLVSAYTERKPEGQARALLAELSRIVDRLERLVRELD